MTRRSASPGGGPSPEEGGASGASPGNSGAGEELGALLAGAARGDAVAWEGIVRLYARRVFALAKSRCRSSDVAEEITQSVFATMAAKLGGEGGYRELGRFEPWLFRVAMNRVRDHVRREKRSMARGELREGVASLDPREPSPQVELGRLREAMEELSDADREVVELRHHAQMSFKQIAELMDEPIGTLLARHHRALRKLKDLLGGEAGGEGEPAMVRVWAGSKRGRTES